MWSFAEFDVQISLDLLECNFFPRVVERKIHLAESADADSAFDGVSRERFGSTRVRELHSEARKVEMEQRDASPL